MHISFEYDQEISVDDWEALVRKLHGPGVDPWETSMVTSVTALLKEAMKDHIYRMLFEGHREVANDAIRAAFAAEQGLGDE